MKGKPRGGKRCVTCGLRNGGRAYHCRGCNAPFDGTIAKAAGVSLPMIAAVANPPAIVRPAEPAYRASIPNFVGNYGSINLDPAHYFDHLIDRESQINIILSALRTADDTNFMVTNHVLLHGPTGSGKSTLVNAVARMIGEEFTLKVSATTSTQAGVIAEITEKGERNIKVIFLSELDKACGNGEAFNWLLSAMDEDRVIRQCNANNIRKIPINALFIADCNNVEKVRRFREGAIHDRFTNEVYCPKLQDDSIFRTIQRYVRMVQGDDAWIQPAIDFVRSEGNGDDIRRMIAVTLDGRDRWLTGEYQNILTAAYNN